MNEHEMSGASNIMVGVYLNWFIFRICHIKRHVHFWDALCEYLYEGSFKLGLVNSSGSISELHTAPGSYVPESLSFGLGHEAAS